MLGLRFCARAFSSCGKRGPLFIAVRGPLTIAASLVAEHGLQTRRLNSCGPRAQLLCGMWDLPRPGLEPVSPALAGRFSTTVPAGKSTSWVSWSYFLIIKIRQVHFCKSGKWRKEKRAATLTQPSFLSYTQGVCYLNTVCTCCTQRFIFCFPPLSILP